MTVKAELATIATWVASVRTKTTASVAMISTAARPRETAVKPPMT